MRDKNMKKFIFILSLIITIFCLFACSDDEDISVQDVDAEPSDSDSTTEDNSESTKTFTFQVNDNMPVYTFTAFIELYPEWNSETTTKIVIADESSGEVIQTIIPPENDLFTKSAVYFSDVTFDGNTDLLIPFQLSAHYVTFYAYIWDETTEQFVKDSSFEDIWNPVIDGENKRIIARDFSDQIASYVMIPYINGEFVLTNSFGFMPADLYVDKVPDADKLMHFYERKRDDDGQTIIVNDFYVLHEELSSEWINIPQLKPYHEPGSFWDLDNPRWECPFHKEMNR